jgi:hypothetical protein
MELHEMLEWAEMVGPDAEELSQILSTQWQSLLDHRWARTVRLNARVNGFAERHELTNADLRVFRYVGWRIQPVSMLLLREPFMADECHDSQLSNRVMIDPLICRADVVEFKKVRRRAVSASLSPDYEAAEEYLRHALSKAGPRTGLKWVYMPELVEIYELPEYQAVRLWTKITRELGFPERGRPRQVRIVNS